MDERGRRVRFRTGGSGWAREKFFEQVIFLQRRVSESGTVSASLKQRSRRGCNKCWKQESSPSRKSFLAAHCHKRAGVSVGCLVAGIRQREWDGFVLSFMRSFMLRVF